jgi:hypothetical protein
VRQPRRLRLHGLPRDPRDPLLGHWNDLVPRPPRTLALAALTATVHPHPPHAQRQPGSATRATPTAVTATTTSRRRVQRRGRRRACEPRHRSSHKVGPLTGRDAERPRTRPRHGISRRAARPQHTCRGPRRRARASSPTASGGARIVNIARQPFRWRTRPGASLNTWHAWLAPPPAHPQPPLPPHPNLPLLHTPTPPPSLHYPRPPHTHYPRPSTHPPTHPHPRPPSTHQPPPQLRSAPHTVSPNDDDFASFA